MKGNIEIKLEEAYNKYLDNKESDANADPVVWVDEKTKVNINIILVNN